jgi:hypothetical protein
MRQNFALLFKLQLHVTTFKTHLFHFISPPWCSGGRWQVKAQYQILLKKGSNGEYFLDRNPALLNFTEQVSIEALRHELDYFGIDLDEDGI